MEDYKKVLRLAQDERAKRVIGFLIGQVMKETAGRAEVKIVQKILVEKLK